MDGDSKASLETFSNAQLSLFSCLIGITFLQIISISSSRLVDLEKDSGSIFPKLKSTVRFSYSFFLSGLKNPFSSFSSLIYHVLQHLNHFSDPSLDLFQSVNVSILFVLENPMVNTAFQMRPPESQVDELTLFNSLPAASVLAHAPQYEVSLRCCESSPLTQFVFHQDLRSFGQSCHLANMFCI